MVPSSLEIVAGKGRIDEATVTKKWVSGKRSKDERIREIGKKKM